jgi:hypothetical protein
MIDHFIHLDPNPVLDDHNLSASQKYSIDVNVEVVSDRSVQFDNGVITESEKVRNLQGTAPQFNRDPERDGGKGLQPGSSFRNLRGLSLVHIPSRFRLLIVFRLFGDHMGSFTTARQSQ